MLGLKGKQVRFGRKSVSTGVIALVAGLLLVAGGGAVYAALQLGAENSTSVNLQSGLGGWWKLDGNGNDSSGNSNNATVSNAALTTDRQGVAGRAYSFSGSGTSYLQGPSGTTGSTLSFTTAFSLSAWVNPTSYHTTGYFGLKNGVLGRGNASTFNYAMQVTDATTVSFIKRTGAEGLQFYNFTGVPSLTNNWSLLTMTISGTSLKLYVNGTLVGTQTVGSIAPGASDPFYIGTSSTNAESSFIGAVDDVRLYDRTLNSAEARALYKERNSYINAASGEKGLLGWWKLDGNGKDSTPYQNLGTFSGGAFIADRKNTSNTAYSFNTSGSKMVLTNPVGQAGVTTASVWYRRNEASSSGSWRTILGHKTANIHPLILNNVSRNLGIWDGSFRDFGYNVPNDNTWHYFTVIYNSVGTAQLYVDGVYRNQVATTLNLGTNPIGTIGNWASGSYWAGDIDDVRLYSRALSQGEITSQYQSYNSQINVNSSPSTGQSNNFNVGLVADWAFNGNAKDGTPYTNNGAVSGAVLTTDRRGRPNSAYSFNGTSDYINCGTSSVLRPATAMTISAWVYITAYSGALSGIVNYGGGGYWLSIGSNGVPYMYITNNTAVNASSVIPLNQWRHIVATYDGASGKIYINGSISGTQAWSGAISGYALNCFIGSNKGVAGRYFQGSLDDVRIHNRALSATEVQALYSTYR